MNVHAVGLWALGGRGSRLEADVAGQATGLVGDIARAAADQPFNRLCQAVHAAEAGLDGADALMKLLSTIPGIGPLNATAFVASIGTAKTFGRGRDLAAWLGLAPWQMTTGEKPKLPGISKRGNGYFRKMLIHGARAALPSPARGKTLLGEWLRGLLPRMHMNTAVAALAAKMARIIWMVLRSGRPFEMAATLSAG